MNPTSLDNFIDFCFNFHIDMDEDWFRSNPSYILEKWDKYIGLDPVLTTRLSKRYLSWCDLWNFDGIDVSSTESKRAAPVIEFLRILNQKRLLAWTLSELIDEFERIIGRDVCEIKTDRYNGLHDLIKIKVKDWKNINVNLREYKLLKILV